jgi:hypothetical protein
VSFHWDRAGEANEKSSCWIRVSQAWAGAGWGAMHIPRIGQEVIVEFLEGDPDRPIITGRVYHGINTPSYSLPEEKTKSTLKSNSSKGGGGFNEIRLEDKKGEEQIFVHAEKDQDIRIKNDRFEWVGQHRHLVVKQDKFEHVENNSHIQIDADHHDHIKNERHLSVGGQQAVSVAASHSITVGGDVIEAFKANHHEQTTGDYYLKAKGIVVEAVSGITLKCGGSNVVIDPSGVTLKGPLVTLDGGMVKISSGPGSPPAAGMAKAASAPTAPAVAREADDAYVTKAPQREKKVAMDGHGGDIGFASTMAQPSPSSAAPYTPSASENWICLNLCDADGRPAAGYPYRLRDSSGVERTGELDKAGETRVSGLAEGPVDVSFGEPLDEQSIASQRQAIKQALDTVLEAERAEAAQIESEYEKKDFAGKLGAIKDASARGAGNAATSIGSSLKELADLRPSQHFKRALAAAWASWRYSEENHYVEQFTQRFAEAEFRELIDVLGLDPRSITREQLAEIQSLVNFIWDDDETQKLLIDFAVDYIDAQHFLEVTETASGLATEFAFDLLITLLTLGAGAAVVVATKVRHAEKLKGVAKAFRKLAQALKKRAGSKQGTGRTGEKHYQSLEKPEHRGIEPGSLDSDTASHRPIDNAELLRDNSAPNTLSKVDDGIPLTGISSLDSPAIGSSSFTQKLDTMVRSGFEVIEDSTFISARGQFDGMKFIYNPETMTRLDFAHEWRHFGQLKQMIDRGITPLKSKNMRMANSPAEFGAYSYEQKLWERINVTPTNEYIN